MDDVLLSVIIPVFNAEKYIRKCIDSILMQRKIPLEIILIDDGSTDNSLEICYEYAQKDQRVKVFHKKNGGVSSARNIGLDSSHGHWISFVDADDYVSEDFYDDIMEYPKADVIQKSYMEIPPSKSVRLTSKELVTSNEIETYFARKRTNALWDKLIKRDIIGDLRFDTQISIGEDFMFFLALIHKVRRYYFSDIGQYYYVKNINSAMEKVKDPAIRLNVLFENIGNIIKYSFNRSLGISIIAQTYIPMIFAMSSYLSKEQITKLYLICKRIKWKDLRYVSFMHKVKFFFIICNLYLLKWQRV